MTYSYVHTKINEEAFKSKVQIYSKEQMTGRGRGKYWYKKRIKRRGRKILFRKSKKYFHENKILYIV